MVKLERNKKYKDYFRVEAYDNNHRITLLTSISKKNLVELREAMDLLLKWEE